MRNNRNLIPRLNGLFNFGRNAGFRRGSSLAAFAALIAAAFVLLASPVPGASAAAGAAAVNAIKSDIMIYDYRAAIEKCKKAAGAEADLETGLLHAKALHLSGDTAGAAARHEALIGKFPGEPAAYAEAARYACEQVRFDDARSFYSAGVEKFTKDAALYSSKKAGADSLITDAFAFYDRMRMRSEEVAIYKTTAARLFRVAPAYFNRAAAYFTDNKMYSDALELIRAAEAAAGSETPLTADAKIGVYEGMIASGAGDASKNIEALGSLYEKYLLDAATGEDKRYLLYTSYFNFLKNNSLLEKKLASLKSAFDPARGPLPCLLLVNLLMQGSDASRAREYLAKLTAAGGFGPIIAASRLYRHYGEYLRAMKMALEASAAAKNDAEKEAALYEMASCLSKFYFVDLRYLIFKNAAVELFEQRCDDLAVNLVIISSSRRFMRATYDAVRVALRQYLSRTAAILYYKELIAAHAGSASRDRYMSELASLYSEIGMHEQAYAVWDMLCSQMKGSPFFAGALKSMVRHHQTRSAPEAAARKACEAIDARADLSTPEGFAAARSALDALVSPENADSGGGRDSYRAYHRTVYDYLVKKRAAAFDMKWFDSNLLSMLPSVYPDFGRRLEILDGMLKNSPYDAALLNAKESCILSNMTRLNSAILKKALEVFYEQNYFVSGELFNKYLQFLNRESRIEAKIEDLKKAAAAGSLPPHKMKLLAGCCFFVSDFEQAEKWYGEFVKYAPSDADSLMRLAGLKRSFGKNAEAVGLLERLIAVEPSNRKAYVTAGDIIALDKTRKWEEADRFFAKITAIDPENNDNYIELATIYWDYFKYDEGLAVLAERRRRSGSGFIFGREIAGLFELNGSIEVAIPEYISVVCAPDPQAAVRHYTENGWEEGLENENGPNRRYDRYNYRYERPETADVIECRARLNSLYKKEKYKTLIDESFEKFMARPEADFKVYYEYSKLLIEFGLGAKAFEVIKRSYPAVTNGYQFIQLASLLERVKKNGEAKTLYYKAIEKDPGQHSSYGDALEFFQRYAMTEDYARTMKARAEKFPEDPYFMEEYSKYMMDYRGMADNGNYREAADALEKLIARNPLSVKYRNLMADVKIKLYGIKAATEYIEGLIKASEAEKDMARKFHVDDLVRLKETLARLLAKDRRVDEALAIRRELIYDNPGETGFADTLADIAAAHDCVKKVADFIGSLDEKKVKQANRLFLFARFYQRLNRFDEAADCYKKLAALNPNDAGVVKDYFALCSRARRFAEAKKLTGRYLQLAAAAGGEAERQAYEDCATLYMQSGDTREAMAVFEPYLNKVLAAFKPDENSYVYYSYQYANEVTWMARLLENHSCFAEAIGLLEKKLEHLERNLKYNKYLIDETNEKISSLYEKSGNAAKALEIIAGVVQREADSGTLASVSDAMLRRLVALWKRTSNYSRNIKQYCAMLDGAGARLDEKQLEVMRFLLRIYRIDSNQAAFIALAKKYETSGVNLKSAIEMAKSSPGFERDLIDLLLKRVGITAGNGGSPGASAVDDMIALGVLMARGKNNSLADDFFGMALKYGRYNDTLKKIAEALLDGGVKDMACRYYNAYLDKCSERSFYIHAPGVALAMMEKECYREALALADRIMRRHGDDIKVMLDCASVYKSAGNSGAAADLFKKAALGAVKVEETRRAVEELGSLMENGEYIKFVDEMAAARHGGGFAPDYAFLYVIKASRLFPDAIAGDARAAAAFDAVNGALMKEHVSADVFVEYFNAVIGAAPSAEKEVSREAAAAMAERYMAYCDKFVEKMLSLEDILDGDAYAALALMIEHLPAPVSFSGRIAPLAARMRPKTGVLNPGFVCDAAFSRASFDSREAELMGFFKAHINVNTDSLMQAARRFIDAGDFTAAAVFADAAVKLDPDDQLARLALLEALCGSGGDAAKASTLAGSIDAAKLKPKNRSGEYYDDGGYSYELADGMIRFAGCLGRLGHHEQAMSVCSSALSICRKHFEFDDSYLMNADYKKALSLYFKSAVTPASRERTAAELYGAFEEYLTYEPRYESDLFFSNRAIIRELGGMLCSWPECSARVAKACQSGPSSKVSAYLGVLSPCLRGGDISAPAAAALSAHRSEYFIVELLASLADDITDGALVEKIFAALAAIDSNNARAHAEASLRRRCSDSLNFDRER